MGPRASRSSKLRGFADGLDGSGGVDVLKMFSRHETRQRVPTPLCFFLDPHRRKSPWALLREQLADEGLVVSGVAAWRCLSFRGDLVCDQLQ
jgi:hypothetical protein